ncbi:Ribose ABC transport system, ATP-binding protein RbsA [Labilithrix luteola]|uniref:Ribose ABC transport system, ATP-binding protein RbsA n=1 Tax=Labilithrix luteola TaxID=1391654 RepID=A0A0K1Q8C2_9BACT|nr:sugar ABC transporter ATP-binding protein [Labilithrix luteola]AKV01979.1 Ribose ABC transport system, ATP-binding protein RbsA [Labilithrix luteola]
MSRGGVLELEGIEKSFGPVDVLRGVSLELARGEIHAVLGENGAGKSTLMRIVLGMESPTRGTMRLAGVPYRPSSPAAGRHSGVVIVPQERTLCPQLTVEENIVLGLEPRRLGFLDRAAARRTALHALSLVVGSNARLAVDSRVDALGVADQQLVEIARALAQAGIGAERERTARVLILDEPTSSLGRDDADRLFERIRALKESGLAILLVTHSLADVRAHVDRFTALRDGKVAASGDARTADPAHIVRAMLGRELEAAYESRPAAADTNAGEVLLEVEGLSGHRKPRSASFVLRRGEVLGIAGLVGSGRTELLRAIVGLDPVRGGRIQRSAPRGIGLLSEDRGGEGLMLDRSIADNVTLSRGGRLWARPHAFAVEARRWIEELAIRASGPDQPVTELSGGNQQKVQIARLLREDYDVLLVDEPTRGIDVASKAQILELVRKLARAGKGIVLVSSQLDELVTTCDRIAVLKDGVLGSAREASGWTEEALMLEAAS